MASIMCAQALWRVVRPPKRPGPAERVDEPVFQGVQFGPWAATMARFDGHDLVIAIDAATYLTLVFRFQAPPKFRANFAAALRDALEDFSAPAGTADLESVVIEAAPLAPLTDRTLRAALNEIKRFCDAELDYRLDLRRVQRILNDLPRPHRDPCVPAEAVAMRFEGPTARPAPRTH
jgi:hypothetical protein